MADSKLDALTEDTAPATTDLLYVEHSPSGTPADRKVQIGNLPFQPLDSDLTAIAALSTTSFGRALLALVDAAALRTAAALGTIATQAASNVAITGGSVTGITDVAVADGGTGASTASAARTNLGLAIGSDVQAYDAELAALAGLTSAADSLPYFTGSGTAAVTTLSSFIRTLIDDADAATARSTLGVDAAGTAAGLISDTAYNASSWDGDTTHAPSKNAVRDKLESLTTAPPVDGLVGATATVAFGTGVTGDTVDRFTVGGDGKISWGPGGSTALDTFLYRNAANVVRVGTTTGHQLICDGTIKAAQGQSFEVSLGGRGPAAEAGFALGVSSDCRIYKVAAATAGTDAKWKQANVLGMVCANAALATNATVGFTYLPSCAGTPTGTPATETGTVPCVIDTTNGKVYWYLGGAWKSVTPA